MALPNCLRSLHVPGRVVERALRDAERLGSDSDAGVVERGQRRAESASLGADQPVRRDPAVVEIQLAGRRALDAELVLGRAEREALVILLNYERRDAVTRPRTDL